MQWTGVLGDGKQVRFDRDEGAAVAAGEENAGFARPRNEFERHRGADGDASVRGLDDSGVTGRTVDVPGHLDRRGMTAAQPFAFVQDSSPNRTR